MLSQDYTTANWVNSSEALAVYCLAHGKHPHDGTGTVGMGVEMTPSREVRFLLTATGQVLVREASALLFHSVLVCVLPVPADPALGHRVHNWVVFAEHGSQIRFFCVSSRTCSGQGCLLLDTPTPSAGRHHLFDGGARHHLFQQAMSGRDAPGPEGPPFS